MLRPRLTRAEFFTRLQLIRVVEPTVDLAYRISEAKLLQEGGDDAPHGNPWHVSFHGSQFPGSEKSCGRAALYRMMDFPSSESTPRHLRQTAEQGKAIEASIVTAWARAGMLLTSADPYNQTGFELPEAWLTSSVDAVILPPGRNRPLPVEIKNRSAKVIAEMQVGARGPFEDHISQLKVQIAFVRLYQEKFELWPLLDLVTHGMIYYVSRDYPLDTAEFRVDFDAKFFNDGVERLKSFRLDFDADTIPELNPGKRTSKFGHPHGWKWSYPPCQWCNFKKTCQLDFREGNTSLSNSIGVRRAKLVRKDYDPEAALRRVYSRWANEVSE